MSLFYDQSGTEIWNTPFVEILFLFALSISLTEYGQNDYNNKEVVGLLNKRLDIVESKLDLILSKIEELEVENLKKECYNIYIKLGKGMFQCYE